MISLEFLKTQYEALYQTFTARQGFTQTLISIHSLAVISLVTIAVNSFVQKKLFSYIFCLAFALAINITSWIILKYLREAIHQDGEKLKDIEDIFKSYCYIVQTPLVRDISAKPTKQMLTLYFVIGILITVAIVIGIAALTFYQ